MKNRNFLFDIRFCIKKMNNLSRNAAGFTFRLAKYAQNVLN